MASKSIGNLAVTLSADSRKLKRGLDQGQRHVRGFSKSAGGTLQKMGAGLAIGVGVAAGAIAVNSMRKAFAAVRQEFSRQLDEIDKSAKFAERIGVGFNALEGLGLAAGTSGVKIEALQMGLQRMTRRVAEAAQGTGEAKGALAELRLNAQRLAQLSPEKQFAAIADRMAEVGSQSQRVRLAFKLFDSEGVALLNTLKGGSKALEAAQQRAHDLGLTLTSAQTRSVEMLNDSWLELKTAFSGIARQLAVQFAPALTALARRFTNLVAESKGFRQAIGDLASFAISGIARSLNAIGVLHRALNTTRQIINSIAIGAAHALEFLNRLDITGLTDNATAGIREFREELEYSNEQLQKVMDRPLYGERFLQWVQEVKREAKELGDAWKVAGNQQRGALLESGGIMPGGVSGASSQLTAMRKAVQYMNQMAEATRRMRMEAAKATLADLRDEARSLWLETRTPLEQLEQVYNRLKMLRDLNLISRDTANRALRAARANLLGGENARSETGSLSRTALTTGVMRPDQEEKRDRKKANRTLEKIEQNTRQGQPARAG